MLNSSNFNGKKLRKKLSNLIKSKGPVNLHEYMNICLYDKEYGYYTTKEHIFGSKGDFITSPEISQMFGEIIGIWMYKVIESFKFPEKVDILEIGAGRGFMMSDIIRSLLTTKKNNQEINFFIVEKSEKLAKIQQENITSMLSKDKIFIEYKFDNVILFFINHQNYKIDTFSNKEKKINLFWFDSLTNYTKFRTGDNFEAFNSLENLKNKVYESNAKLK